MVLTPTLSQVQRPLPPTFCQVEWPLPPTFWQVSALTIQTQVVWALTLLTQTLRSVFGTI